ncbi:hypothetical protein FQN49_001379 [Arthroderma sp. PD_2]|nr:hypothetical protein FQN49_001379 [Arthroderma sp. PD_2]
MPKQHPYLKLRLPRNAPFELKPSPGKGWGVFATKNIKKGALILREKPLFVIRAPLEGCIELEIVAAFQKLTPTEKRQFLCLRDNGSEVFKCMTDAFVDNNSTVSSILKNGANDYPARGLFILHSRFNHSCVPNTKAPFTGKKAISTYATRDIVAGEELTTFYDTNVLFHPRQERHKALRFVCDCKACKLGTPFHELSETRKTLIRGLMYLKDGVDVDGKRQRSASSIIIDRKLKKKAEDSNITLSARLIYRLFIMYLMEEEGQLDDLTVALHSEEIDKILIFFRTESNLEIARLALRQKTWLGKLLMAFRLYGQRDAADHIAMAYFGDKSGLPFAACLPDFV